MLHTVIGWSVSRQSMDLCQHVLVLTPHYISLRYILTIHIDTHTQYMLTPLIISSTAEISCLLPSYPPHLFLKKWTANNYLRSSQRKHVSQLCSAIAAVCCAGLFPACCWFSNNYVSPLSLLGHCCFNVSSWHTSLHSGVNYYLIGQGWKRVR